MINSHYNLLLRFHHALCTGVRAGRLTATKITNVQNAGRKSTIKRTDVAAFSTTSQAAFRNAAFFDKEVDYSQKPDVSSSELNDDDDEEEFGSIARKHDVTVFKLPTELQIPDKEDERENDKPRRRSKNTPYWFFLQCKKLAKQNKTMECVKFLEERMIKNDRVLPQEQNFTVVMGALGRIGYAKKAFQLYSKMKDRALRPTLATYTALFNAVASSPYENDIRRAVKLYEEVHRKRIRLNRITYNSAIKAFGRHGTMEQMMGIFRESITAGFEPDSETFNMIFHSLERDKISGFRHAVEVWRQMIMLDIKPDGKTIMYFLKVLKNCGIGDLETANRKLIQELPNPEDYKGFFKNHIRNVYWLKGQVSHPEKMSGEGDKFPELPVLTIEPGDELQEEESLNCMAGDDLNEEATQETFSKHRKCDTDEELEANDSGMSSSLSQDEDLGLSSLKDSEEEALFNKESCSHLPDVKHDIPNLLTNIFNKGNDTSRLYSIRNCELPWHRLQLIGGHRYILDLLKKHNIKPTVMLLSTLVQILKPDVKAENEIMDLTEEYNIPIDVDFYNMVLHQRAKRLQHADIKKVLRRIAERGLSPNYRTWCILALSSVDGRHGISLINEIKKAKVELDHVFFNSLICAAIKNKHSSKVEGYEVVTGYDYNYLSRIIQEMKVCKVKADHQMISLLEMASEWPDVSDGWQRVSNFRKIYREWLDEVEMVEDKKPFAEFRKEKFSKPLSK